MGTNRYGKIAVVPLVSLLLLAPGCEDPDAEAKEAIRASLRQLDRANLDCDGAAAVAVMSSDGLAEYSRLVRLALDGTRRDVMLLDPLDKWQVVQLRNRLTRQQLEGMDGAAYQAYATSECWYNDPYVEGYVDGIGDISVYDGIAYADVLDEDGNKSGVSAEFTLEDGEWKVNEFTFHRVFNEWVRELAELENMTVDRYIMLYEELEWGNPVRDRIWDPLR